jgi:uncharacterized protein
MTSTLDNPLVQQFLFHPRRVAAGGSRLKNAIDGTVPVDGGVVLGYRLYAHKPGSPVIVYFHGNGEVAAEHDDIAPMYHAIDASLLVFDYRGYGWSTGKPSVSAMNPDTEAIHYAVPGILDQAALGRSPLILMGRSLGSAPAIHLACAYPQAYRGLIIESGFAQVIPLLARLGLPIGLMGETADPVGNLEKMREIKLPLLIIHGDQDSLIPVSQGVMLYEASPSTNKRMKRIGHAGHNDMLYYAEEYFEAVGEFLNGI